MDTAPAGKAGALHLIDVLVMNVAVTVLRLPPVPLNSVVIERILLKYAPVIVITEPPVIGPRFGVTADTENNANRGLVYSSKSPSYIQ